MGEAIRPRRSVLYMPGSNPRALDKARTLPADALIFDLEDAVAPDAKQQAREQVREAVVAGGYGAREVVIRVNALSSPWGTEDLMAAIAARPDAILIPKVSSPEDLAPVRDTFSACDVDGAIALWAMMETPLAMLNAGKIAAAARDEQGPLTCMVMGTNDLAKETGASLGEGRAGVLAWLSICVAAAKAHGLAIVDGVYNDFRDADGFAAEARQGRAFGMDGKTLIHPGQIAPANDIFSPSPEEIEAARRIVAAFEQPENKGKGAIDLDGRMVELLHAEVARRSLALAAAIAAMAQAAEEE